MSARRQGSTKRRATIDDVAERAGVSIKTVSRVLNREPHVSPKTVEAVMGAVADLGYTPNVAARRLAGSRSYLLCLLYDNPSGSYVSNVQTGAMRRCQREGYHLVVEECREGAEAADHVRRILEASRPDGVILTPPLCDNAAVLAALREARVAAARIGPGAPGPAGLDVRMNDEAAAYEMTLFLIGLGHRRIAFVRGHPDHAAAAARLQGFRAAMSDNGLKVEEELVAPGRFSFKSGVDAAGRLLDLARRPTAIFAANDDMAAGVLFAAHARGIPIPDQLSVAGFDDTPLAGLIWPQLTTVRQPIVDMADEAVALLVQRRGAQAGPGDARPGDVVLEFEIVARGSTAPPGSVP